MNYTITRKPKARYLSSPEIAEEARERAAAKPAPTFSDPAPTRPASRLRPPPAANAPSANGRASDGQWSKSPEPASSLRASLRAVPSRPVDQRLRPPASNDSSASDALLAGPGEAPRDIHRAPEPHGQDEASSRAARPEGRPHVRTPERGAEPPPRPSEPPRQRARQAPPPAEPAHRGEAGHGTRVIKRRNRGLEDAATPAQTPAARPRIGREPRGTSHRRRRPELKLQALAALAAMALLSGGGLLIWTMLTPPESAPQQVAEAATREAGTPPEAPVAAAAATPTSVTDTPSFSHGQGGQPVQSHGAEPASAPASTPAPAATGPQTAAFLEPIDDSQPASGSNASPSSADAQVADTTADAGAQASDASADDQDGAAAAPAGSDSAPLPHTRPPETAQSKPSAKSGEKAAASAGSDEGRAGRLTQDVNMRSAPRKGASTITILSGGQSVRVISCKGWCEIIAKGKRGYVFKEAVKVSG